ncbi:tetratricopeptide repeat protein 4-like isoform X2 [Varroa destructor]|uniref:Cns1/TTC4 wheel domain-containing protein n=1 Tax=Varroa destructor TaxID=109461 RepID=A0A7M7KVL6_VARDE|nr:tetratricopeptide repeat protein 4-like isoform X2 [Varroa destructor]
MSGCSTSGSANPTMSDKERERLMRKLEKETDEFLASRKQAKYQDGWKEQSWEKEMADHPLFAQQLPDGATRGNLPPLLEALRQVKYDEAENSPEELARNYKDDGNHLFKEKSYRLRSDLRIVTTLVVMHAYGRKLRVKTTRPTNFRRAAVASYSEGIYQKTLNQELNAQLHLNRAAAQYHLDNFNAALDDCILALKFKPNYVKAMLRAAQCCWQLRKLHECIKFCVQLEEAEGAQSVPSAALKEARELVNRVEKEQKLQERNRRKREKELRERRQKNEELAVAIEKARVTLVPAAEEGELLPNLTPRFPALRDFAVSLESDVNEPGQKCLVWPVALVYPELKETDFVQKWSEGTTFSAIFDAMYQGRPAERPVIGDEENNTVIVYDPAKLQVWYKSSKNDKPVAVRDKSSLRQVLARKDCIVEDGVPSFWVTRKGSEAEKDLLNRCC